MPFGSPLNVNTLAQIKPVVNMSYKVKCLIFGPPGVGKTIFAANAPSPCMLDADGTGAMSLLNFPELAIKTRTLQIRSFSQMSDVFEGYKTGDPRVQGVETFVIDTMSQLTKLHLDGFIDSELRDHPTREPVPFQRDYRYNTEAMRRCIQWFMDLDTNLIVLCHSESHQDEHSKMTTIKPFLTPRLLSSMEAVFDVFGYMTSNTDNQFKVSRTLQVQPTLNVWAKSRIGNLPPVIADPTFSQILWAKEQMVDKVRELYKQKQDEWRAKQAEKQPEVPASKEAEPVTTIQLPVKSTAAVEGAK